jgi:hypothetical protein
MSKARDLADFISTGSILSDGTLETVEIDGVTATPVELNKLDGATVTTAELNKLNGATVTTTEINYLSGVTSAVQTQVDAKASTFTTNVITTNTTASANNHYYLNAATITLTLPASPSVGDEVRISEVAGNTDCVIGRNGSKIMGDASDLTIDTAYLVLSLRYVDATNGWAFS